MKLLRKEIPTDRLLLKPYDIKYYQAFSALITQNKLRLHPSFPNLLKANETIEDTKNYILQKIYDWNHDKSYAFMIIDKSNQQLIGHVNIKDVDWKKRQTELSYFIDKNYESKGYTTEATQKIIRLCFLVLQFERVFVRIVTTNSASQKVAEKIGLKWEGTFLQDYVTYDNQIVDTYCYGISKTAFEQQ